ncbi:MAG: hypothetical protein J5806_13515 [Lentisphaeria bacterium]|nr:hypothetical protein [Lentisphaeria bacterium]
MNPVWLSRDSWEKIWYALHNIQLRIGSSIDQPAANLTGAGAAARLMVDLPERPRQNVLWRCRVRELETDRWELRFFTDQPSNPKHIHYRGEDICFEDDFIFEITRSDLTSGPIYAVIIRKAHPATGHVFFTVALTRCCFQILEEAARFAIGVFPVARIDLQNGRITVESYYDSTINWPDPYPAGPFHAEMVFADLPGVSGSGFQDFLSATKQQLAISEQFSVCVNNYYVSGTKLLSGSDQYPSSRLDLTQEGEDLGNPLYVFWSAQIGGNTITDCCKSPTRIRYEIRSEIRDPVHDDYNGNLLDIPVAKLRTVSAGNNSFYRIVSENDLPARPLLWINTFGKDLNPYISGFVGIDLERKRLIVNTVYCCRNGDLLNAVPLSYSGSYETFTQFGPLYVCCRYRVANNDWSHFWLQLGNRVLTGSGDPQTGTLYRQQIAEIRLNRDGDPYVAMQNFSKYVFFDSTGENISAFLTRFADLEDRIESLENAMQDAGTRIGLLERYL